MARRPNQRGMTTRQIRPLPESHAKIDTRDQSRSAQVLQYSADGGSTGDASSDLESSRSSIRRLIQFAEHNGNLCGFLELGVVSRIGADAVREWQADLGTCSEWCDQAEQSLEEAAQENAYGGEGTGKNTPWADASNIRYPILSKASLDWNARAYPELVKGDQLVKARTFAPVPQSPSPAETAAAGPAPQSPDEQQAVQGQVQQGVALDKVSHAADQAREARGKRKAMFINHVIFYQMKNWEVETDLLFAQMPAIGQGFKKVYMGPHGVQSDFVSPLNLTVDNNRTKSINTAPRATHDYEKYPYEIDQMIAAGRWNDVVLTPMGSDPQAPRVLLEQTRYEDLDDDGMVEPYLVTIDIDTHQVLCIEAAYTMDDVHVDLSVSPPKVLGFEAWETYADFKFLPDPRGKFMGMGLGRLLRSITDAVDTSINQMMDGNTAAIAGGGFLGGGVRLAGSGQAGGLFFKPGEFQSVNVPGQDIRAAIYERTLPNLGPATMQLLELLLAAAKDLASVKDVLSGEGPANAPVGTTLALQQQAMQSFTAVFKRVMRGFHEEAKQIHDCLRRWARPQDKKLYQELTGGDWEEDWAEESYDIELVADPNVVSKVMKMARLQALSQLAESQVGQAAGMLQPGPAQALVKEGLDAMDIDRPERFLADPQPNPEALAKTADLQASAQAKQAGASLDTQKAQNLESEANLNRARSLRELALAHNEGDKLNQAADNLMTTGLATPPEEAGADGSSETPPGAGPAAGPPPGGAPGAPAGGGGPGASTAAGP